jgi:hypothetical protein
MDAPKRVFKLIQLKGDWFWRLDINNDDGLIGPFMSRDEAEKDAKETLGIVQGRDDDAGESARRLPSSPRACRRESHEGGPYRKRAAGDRHNEPERHRRSAQCSPHPDAGGSPSLAPNASAGGLEANGGLRHVMPLRVMRESG